MTSVDDTKDLASSIYLKRKRLHHHRLDPEQLIDAMRNVMEEREHCRKLVKAGYLGGVMELGNMYNE